ncbi:MAG: ComEC/Rec2 family competence protein [Epsilonproteobacteria bacterium]|nr:ComEC/Rec2 family competence protein [Campylobacterota bacterium]
MIAPAPLFISYKERIVAFIVLLLIFVGTLTKEYLRYTRLIGSKQRITAQVIYQYKKGRKWVLKLKTTDGDLFYTTSYEDLKNLRGRWVEVLIFSTKKPPSFLDFLKQSFYLPSYLLSLLPEKDKVITSIQQQHQDPFFKQLFTALFTAFPMERDKREYLSRWGVNHLVAISGFHLSLISSFVSFLIIFSLKPFWEKFFPYLNLTFYAILISLGVVFGYVFFLGAVPSVIRSLVMLVLGVLLYFRHLKLLSFETLFWVVLIVLALFPSFLFSVGFWFSVSGVFLIYLFLHHFSNLSRWKQFLFIHFFLFFGMLPLSLYFFKGFSFSMLFSPFLTMLFYLFYPLELLLHLLGYGGALDPLLSFLKEGSEMVRVEFSFLELFLYLLGLFFSIFFRFILYLTAFALGVDLIHKIA